MDGAYALSEVDATMWRVVARVVRAAFRDACELAWRI